MDRGTEGQRDRGQRDRGTEGQRDRGTEGQRDRRTDGQTQQIKVCCRRRAHNTNPKSQCDRANNVQQPAPVCKTKSLHTIMYSVNRSFYYRTGGLFRRCLLE